MSIEVDWIRLSYEGEGDLIGLKTLFCRYPAGSRKKARTDRVLLDRLNIQGLAALFVNADLLAPELLEALSPIPLHCTVEVNGNGLSQFFIDMVHEHIEKDRADHRLLGDYLRYFMVCWEYRDLHKFAHCHNVFIKVPIETSGDVSEKIHIANSFALDGHKVLLMPTWKSRINEFGLVMEREFPNIHRRVRFVPPVQNLLGIE